MFERFTQDARRVVVLAQEEARLLNHNYIGTEHLLLGLGHQAEGVAAKALESLGISVEALRAQVEEIIGRGQTAPSGHIPFTPRAKKVLELSLREALQLGHNYIGTAHILLGVVREGEGVAAQILVKLAPRPGLPEVRQRVVQLLAASGGRAEDEPETAGVATPPFAPVAGGPGPYLAQEPTELVRVVPLAREVYRGAGIRIVLISLEIWSRWLDLRYVLLPVEAPAAQHLVPLSWRVADNAGTAYELMGAATGGGRLIHISQLGFSPAPPEEARVLTLAVSGPEGEDLAEVEIDLAGPEDLAREAGLG
jgi:hypothetical protein